jgi:hypothetical protein
MENSQSGGLPENIAWLADAPMFIDADQVARFYDAVVRPEGEAGTTTLQMTEQKVKELKGKLGLKTSAQLTLGELFESLSNLLPSLKDEIEGSATGEEKTETTTGKLLRLNFNRLVPPSANLCNSLYIVFSSFQNGLF